MQGQPRTDCERVTWDPHKWPKINGFQWGLVRLFHPDKRSYFAILKSGFWAHLLGIYKGPTVRNGTFPPRNKVL